MSYSPRNGVTTTRFTSICGPRITTLPRISPSRVRMDFSPVAGSVTLSQSWEGWTLGFVPGIGLIGHSYILTVYYWYEFRTRI